MSDQPNPKLKRAAHMRGLGPQLLFAVDTKSLPGKWIIHFVRCETIVFDDNPLLDQTKFKMLHHDNDPRLMALQESFQRAK